MNLETNVIKPSMSTTIDGSVYNILNFSDEMSLDEAANSVTKYMEQNTGNGLSEEEKDHIYAACQELWKNLSIKLRDGKMNFYLNRPQYNLLTDLIIKKLEYDVNTLFVAIELRNLLLDMKGTKYSTDEEVKSFLVTPTEITYIYHLIATHKVRGLTKESITFSEVLIRIGEISKIVNYYDTLAKNLKDDVTKWALSYAGDTPDMAEEAIQ